MEHLDVTQARFNMVEQQVRPWEVLNQQVLDLMMELPREDFAPEIYQSIAYADVSIPLGKGEVMLPPRLAGRILQALDVQNNDRVLEIGTGSGYLTALLAKLARRVHTVERIEDFSRRAAERLTALGFKNIVFEVGDALNGWPQHAPYDVIAVTGSTPTPPEAYRMQLSIEGRLFIVAGESPLMHALLITRTSTGEWRTESLFETDIPPLYGAAHPAPFVF